MLSSSLGELDLKSKIAKIEARLEAAQQRWEAEIQKDTFNEVRASHLHHDVETISNQLTELYKLLLPKPGNNHPIFFIPIFFHTLYLF
jgi:hypothetical protein